MGFGFFLISYLILIFIFGDYGINALYSFKTYFLPLLFVFAIHFLNRYVNWLKVGKILIINSIIMVIFSFIQVFFIGDSIYLNANYVASELDPTKLKYTFYIGFGLLQRASGGFIAPIPYALYLVFVIVLLTNYKSILRKKIINILLVLGLLFTFTRSAIASYVVLSLFPSIKKSKKYLVFYIFLGISSFFLLDLFYSSDTGLLFETLSVLWDNSVKLEDASTAGHLDSFQTGLNICLDNFWLGQGIGSIGSNTGHYIAKPIVLESAYFSAWAEIGFIAMIIFFYLLMFFDSKNIKSIKIILIYALVAIILPVNYYLELSIIFIIIIQINNQILENGHNRR